MKILFFQPCAFMKPHLCSLIDEAEKYIKDGHDVYFASCSGLMNCCLSNPTANHLDCLVCRFSMKKSLSLLSSPVHIINLNKVSNINPDKYRWEYSTIKELKKITYNGVELGYSVLSLYITVTRNLNPLINKDTKPYFDNLLTQGAILSDSFLQILNTIKPDKTCVFNGRLVESRPILELSLLNHIPVDVYELMGGVDTPYYKVIFQNSLPHDIDYIEQMIEKAWENSTKSLEEKIRIGKSFFENRRNGIAAGDKVYISSQQKGLLPSDWDPSKRNIVIFNSSEDEFAAVGDQFDKYALFSSQIQGIRTILELFKDRTDIHFYLRVHPNLKHIKYKYHTDLYQLSQNYSNVTVIHAADTISTYTLMDSAEKIIVFGSTMGIESVYSGHPVILLAGAIYYNYDICYKPNTVEQLKVLIDNENLAPKQDLLACYKYGFYALDTERSVCKSIYYYYNYNSVKKFIGKRSLSVTFCQKIFGSSYLYAYFMAFLRFIAEKFCVKKRTIPLQEE